MYFQSSLVSEKVYFLQREMTAGKTTFSQPKLLCKKSFVVLFLVRVSFYFIVIFTNNYVSDKRQAITDIFKSFFLILWNLLFTMFVLLPYTYCFLIKLLKINHLSKSWMSISIIFIIIIINLVFPEHQSLYKFWDQYIKVYDWIINIFAIQQFCSFGTIDISMILCVKIWKLCRFLGLTSTWRLNFMLWKRSPSKN